MTEETVKTICLETFNQLPGSVERNGVGIGSYVYTIEINESKYVLKISEEKAIIYGSSYWLNKLKTLELPIPEILAINTQTFPYYFIMSFIPGEDLSLVYNTLSNEQKKAIAQNLYQYQIRLKNLPPASGFGFLHSYDDTNNMKKSWKEVVESHIERSEQRILQNKIFSIEYINRVRNSISYFDEYFNTINPSPFFDDTTTKNVLISDGKLSGIIDLDWLCFGDRLYFIALTTMSLLSMRADLEYIEYLKMEEHLTPIEEEVLLFYTLVFCIDFMSEKGMKFNKEEPEPVKNEEIQFLENTFEEYFHKLEQIKLTASSKDGS